MLEPVASKGSRPFPRLGPCRWRQNISKEQALKLVTLDPHGPNDYRANGPLANMPEFHEAWRVQPGDAMHLPAEERVDIW